MTAEHLRVVLDSPSCTSLSSEAVAVGTGNIPEEVVRAIRSGRLTALQKPDGGVRGIVVGDVFQRVVARTIAQQYARLGEAATHPFQCVHKGWNRVRAHIIQAMTSEIGKPQFCPLMVSVFMTSFPEMPCSEGWQTGVGTKKKRKRDKVSNRLSGQNQKNA